MGRVLTAFLVALAVLPAALAMSKAQPRVLMHSGDDPASRDAISDLIETIRRIIREGSEDPYVPVLDPLQFESQDLSLNEIGAYEVKAGLRNVVSTGLGDFIATMSSRYSLLLRAYVTVDISIPVINARGKYSLNTLLGEVVRLYGDGNFDLDIRELNVTVDADIALRLTSSQLRSLTTTLNVGDFQLVVDGLLEGGVVDSIFNLAVSEVAKIIFDSQKTVLEDYLASSLAEPISEAIKDIGMSDLLCLIGLCGSGDDDDVSDDDGDSNVIDSGDTGGSGEDSNDKGSSGEGSNDKGSSGDGDNGDGGNGDGGNGDGGNGDGGNGDGGNGDGGNGDGGNGDGGNGDGGNGDGGNGEGGNGEGGNGNGSNGDGGNGDGDGNEAEEGGRAH